MNEQNNFYKKQYFDLINERLDVLEKKIDDLIIKVNWIYAWSAGVGTVAALIMDYLFKK